MIIVIDYGMGNMRSVEKALKKIGAEFKISSNKEDLEKATHIIIPGVGSFGEWMKNLKALGLIEVLRKEVLENQKPLLGICLGMQLLFKTSEEGRMIQGLGFIDGNVKRFNFEKNQKSKSKLKIPHIGWNDVFSDDFSKLDMFKGVTNKSDFYFVHSYHPILKEKIPCAYTNYGYDFVSAVQKDNIYGTQFHPEKSQKKGLKLLENFISIKSRFQGEM